MIKDLQDKVAEAINWRRDLHRHPQTSYEETYASSFIAKRLEEMGIEVHRDLAVTGVVGVIEGKGGGNRAIGLRADIDALDIEEESGVAWRSEISGKMHACGHDGHTAMLLCAASYLAEHRNFSGKCYVIFQPAEEGGAGADRMIKDGLFTKFPMESVWGLHNWPGKPEGWFGVRKGAMMAAADTFDIVVRGEGGHAAMPHECIDPIVVASQIVLALQNIVARRLDPFAPAVVSVTTFHGGSADNIIADEVLLGGTVRTMSLEARDFIEQEMNRVITGIAQSLSGSATLHYNRNYPALINSSDETELAAEVAGDVVGVQNVDYTEAVMGAEDFAFMLQERPGSYIFMGSGENRPTLHNAGYDFNDDVLETGARYWIHLTEKLLPVA